MTETERLAAGREARNVAPLAIWTFAWLATLALARFGPTWWGETPTATWIAVGVNVVVGIGWIVAHAAFLRGADELWRKIMLDAIAIALGVGLVAGFAASIAQQAGLLGFEPNIALLSILMGVVYLVSVVIGWMRYR